MSKIFTAELHGNENANILFNAAIIDGVHRVRAHMANLATSRKADEYAPGAIHALRKLCAGEKESRQIHRIEVEEWQAVFFAWFQRVQKHFPATLAKKFKTNAEDDFRTILQCATEMPEGFWRDEVPKRYIRISFENDAALQAARDAAEEKHPVELGNALHQYLDSCIAKLIDRESPPKVVAETPPADAESLTIRFSPGRKHGSLSVHEFGCFDTPENLEQDIVVTAYDVEDAVKKYLKTNSPKLRKSLRFECESSLFVVRSADPSALAAVVAALYAMAANRELLAA